MSTSTTHVSVDEPSSRKLWAMVGTVVGSIASLATIHAVIIVPAILHAAGEESRSVVEKAAREAAEERRRLVTREEFGMLGKEIERIHLQLDRIEEKVTGGR